MSSDSLEGAVEQSPVIGDWMTRAIGGMVVLAAISLAASVFRTGVESFQTELVAVGLFALVIVAVLWEGVITRV